MSAAVENKKLSLDTLVVVTNAYRRAVALQLGDTDGLKGLSRSVGKCDDWARQLLVKCPNATKSAKLKDLVNLGRQLSIDKAAVIEFLSLHEDSAEQVEASCFDSCHQMREWIRTEGVEWQLTRSTEYEVRSQPTPYVRAKPCRRGSYYDNTPITNAYRKLIALGAVQRLKSRENSPTECAGFRDLDWGVSHGCLCNRLTRIKTHSLSSSKTELLRMAEVVGVRDQAEKALNIRQAGDDTSVFKTLTDAYNWGVQALSRDWKLEHEKMQLNEIDRQLLLDSGYELEEQDEEEEAQPAAETETVEKQGLRYRIAGLERARDLLTQEIEALKAELSKSLMEVCG